MPKAIWKGKIIAESEVTVVVENNHYFPPESIKVDHFKESDHSTKCSWKGTARYYHIEVNGDVNENAAWYYPDPKEAAASIKDHVAFWNGVEILAD